MKIFTQHTQTIAAMAAATAAASMTTTTAFVCCCFCPMYRSENNSKNLSTLCNFDSVIIESSTDTRVLVLELPQFSAVDSNRFQHSQLIVVFRILKVHSQNSFGVTQTKLVFVDYLFLIFCCCRSSLQVGSFLFK